MHVHGSALDAMVMFAFLIIIGALWRTTAIKLSDRSIGRAMAFVY